MDAKPARRGLTTAGLGALRVAKAPCAGNLGAYAVTAVAALLLSAMTSCTWPNGKASPRPATDRPAADDPPQVVHAPESQPADPLLQAVQGYLERINAAKTGGRTKADVAGFPGEPGSTDYAADAQPASSQPAASQPSEAETEPETPAKSAGEPTATTQSAAPGDVSLASPSPAATSADALPGASVPDAPPRLGSIRVHADPAGPAAVGGSEMPGPQVNAPAFARNAPASLRELLERLPAGDDSFREQLDRRVLALIAGDFEKARAPLNLVTAEQQALATRFVEALIQIREWHMGDQPAAATAAAREITELQEALQKLSELSVPLVKICSAVHGYGQYEAIEPARIPAGSGAEFVLYCEVSSFVSAADPNGGFTTTFDMTTAIINRVGDTVFELKDPGITDHCRNRRHDCFIPRLVRLPAALPPGQYVAKVTVVDKLGQKVAENRATLALGARR